MNSLKVNKTNFKEFKNQISKSLKTQISKSLKNQTYIKFERFEISKI